MDTSKLKYVVDGYAEGKPAIIRFYGDVDYWNVSDFNSEFVWLEEYIRPSKIVVLINSAGGSVIEGMSSFSVIQSCTIPTECVIEGIAASMGSIIWAAGDKLYMHDYSILMIHNPFMWDADAEDDDTKQAIAAFRAQLEMIYCKRFGMSEEQVREIMDGPGDADGTYFTAAAAVQAGFIPESHVLVTTQAIQDSIRQKVEGAKGAGAICKAMAAALGDIDGNALLGAIDAIHDKNEDNSHSITKEMNENDVLFKTVVAQLGMAEDSTIASVSASITRLQENETALESVKGELAELKIKYEGKEAEAKNLLASLEEANAALQVYKDAEKAAFENEVAALVDSAIAAGKIAEDAKAAWVEMAHTNLEVVKSTLASIPERKIVTQEIAKDPANARAAAEALKSAEEKMQEKVQEVVGEVNFATF